MVVVNLAKKDCFEYNAESKQKLIEDAEKGDAIVIPAYDHIIKDKNKTKGTKNKKADKGENR